MKPRSPFTADTNIPCPACTGFGTSPITTLKADPAWADDAPGCHTARCGHCKFTTTVFSADAEGQTSYYLTREACHRAGGGL